MQQRKNKKAKESINEINKILTQIEERMRIIDNKTFVILEDGVDYEPQIKSLILSVSNDFKYI